MQKQKNRVMKYTQLILGMLTVSAFLFFLLGEVLLPPENVSGHRECRVFRADWVQVMADGSQEHQDYGEVRLICVKVDGKWYMDFIMVMTMSVQNGTAYKVEPIS